jgi:hypothetical protein
MPESNGSKQLENARLDLGVDLELLVREPYFLNEKGTEKA